MNVTRRDSGTSLGNQSEQATAPAQRGRIGKFVHAVRTAVLIEGGLLNTFRTVFTVLKNEGWSGFRHRVGGALSKSNRTDYAEWVKRYDTLDENARARIRKKIAKLERQPLISVLMPTYNTPARWLQEAIDSVRGQLYEHWELCIADDASTDPATREVLEQAMAEDKRIKVTFRRENGHTSTGKRRNLLEEAIQSNVNQTYVNFELVILADESHDHSYDVTALHFLPSLIHG